MSQSLKSEDKSDEIFRKYLDESNEHYKNEDYEQAMYFINKALCYAKSSRATAFAYANRSVFYNEVNCYAEGLLNVKWAMKNKYPEKYFHNLEKRERIFMEKLEKEVEEPVEDPMAFFDLSYPSNPKIPFIIKDLEMRVTEKYGKGIYATRDLKSGDFIALEEPVISMHRAVTNKPHPCYSSCVNCMKSNKRNLATCRRSVSIMFCSKECCDKINDRMSDLTHLTFTGNVTDVEKVYADIVEKFGDREKLLKFAKKMDWENFNFSIFDFDFSDPSSPDNGINMIKCLLSFNIGAPKVSKTFIKGPIAQGNKKLAGMLKLATNIFHGMNYIRLSNHAVALCFGGLLNHSCIPNVTTVPVDNKVAYYVVRPVKKGEQLLISYTNWGDQKSRENFLSRYFDFKCDCVACEQKLTINHSKKQEEVERMPVYRTIPEIKEVMSSNWTKSLNHLNQPNSKTYWKIFLLNKRLAEHKAWRVVSPFPEVIPEEKVQANPNRRTTREFKLDEMK